MIVCASGAQRSGSEVFGYVPEHEFYAASPIYGAKRHYVGLKRHGSERPSRVEHWGGRPAKRRACQKIGPYGPYLSKRVGLTETKSERTLSAPNTRLEIMASTFTAWLRSPAAREYFFSA